MTSPAPAPYAELGASTTSASAAPHAGKTVLMLIDDLDIRVIDKTTPELLRQLILDPTRNHQPRK